MTWVHSNRHGKPRLRYSLASVVFGHRGSLSQLSVEDPPPILLPGYPAISWVGWALGPKQTT